MPPTHKIKHFWSLSIYPWYLTSYSKPKIFFFWFFRAFLRNFLKIFKIWALILERFLEHSGTHNKSRKIYSYFVLSSANLFHKRNLQLLTTWPEILSGKFWNISWTFWNILELYRFAHCERISTWRQTDRQTLGLVELHRL